MFEKLIPWMILWAASTTGVLVLFVWRVLVARHERSGIYIVEGEEKDLEAQARISKALSRIDLWGKTLTVVSVALVLVIGSLWAVDAWQAPYR